MGTLNPPPSGTVYLDANSVIYSVEKHPVYGPLLRPIWQAAKTASVEIVSSELVLLETRVSPLKSNDVALAEAYERLFQQKLKRDCCPSLKLSCDALLSCERPPN